MTIRPVRDTFVTVGSWFSIRGDVRPALPGLRKPFIGQLSDAVNPTSRLGESVRGFKLLSSGH